MANENIEKRGRRPQLEQAEQAEIKEQEQVKAPEAPEAPEMPEEAVRMTGDVLVVIPHTSTDEHLRLAIAGIRKHFKVDAHIVVYGDVEGEVDAEVMSPGEGPVNAISATKAALSKYYGEHYVILASDTQFAVNDFDMFDVAFLKQRKRVSDSDAARRTREVLSAKGLPVRNFDCGLPVLLDVDKLDKIQAEYDLANNDYVLEDLYFNTCYPTRIPFTLDINTDNLKCGVYRGNPRTEFIDRAFKEKIWISISPEGWVPYLEKLIKEHYEEIR